jgi:AraC-like DNA-binding protein
VAIVDPVLLRLWSRLAALATQSRLRRLAARKAPAWPSQRAHLHDIPTLIACLEGVVRVGTAGGDLDLYPGEVLAVAPGAWHEHVALRPGCAWYGQGLKLHGSDVIVDDGERRGAYFTVAREPAASLLGILVSEADAATRAQAFRRLLTDILDSPGERTTAGEFNAERMHGALWHGLSRQLRARDVLAAAVCSPRQAHRCFCASFGETPKQAILRRKLALARQFLAEGGSVAEAAAAPTSPAPGRGLSGRRRRAAAVRSRSAPLQG